MAKIYRRLKQIHDIKVADENMLKNNTSMKY